MQRSKQNHTATDLLKSPDRGRDGDRDSTARELLQLITDRTPAVSYVTLCCHVSAVLFMCISCLGDRQKVKHLVPKVQKTTMNHLAN